MIEEFNVIDENLVQIGDWLGSGSEKGSAVFKGVLQDVDGPVEVAVKKIQLWRYTTKEELDTVLRELNIMQSVPHASYICRMYGACKVRSDSGSEVWVVMQYANGGDLRHFMEGHNGTLPQALQLNLLLQASKAVQVLHNRPEPILHRDIKSFNFLVQKDNNGIINLLLTDFGISKPQVQTQSTTPTVGSLRWMPPEIIMSTKKRIWTDKADIYSLGMVFYEILTKQLPYRKIGDENVIALLERIKSGKLPKIPEDCPKALAKLIKKCLNPKPENRPDINNLVRQLEIICALLTSPERKPTKQRSQTSVGEEKKLDMDPRRSLSVSMSEHATFNFFHWVTNLGKNGNQTTPEPANETSSSNANIKVQEDASK